MCSDSHNSRGWVSDSASDQTVSRVMATTTDRVPGAETAREVTQQLNQLLESAADPRVEYHLIEAREQIEDRDSSVLEALESAENELEYAEDETSDGSLGHRLRELRQAIIGLVDGEEAGSV